MKRLILLLTMVIGALAVFVGPAMASSTPAPKGPPPPFGLTVGPPKTSAAPGQSVKMFIYNAGTSPIGVTLTAHQFERNAQGVCVVDPAVVPWVQTSPAQMSLPYQNYKYATVSIDPGQRSQTGLIIEATGRLQAAPGQVALTGTNTTQILVKGPKSGKPCVSLPVQKHPAPFKLPIVPLAITLGVLLLALIVWLARRSGHKAALRKG